MTPSGWLLGDRYQLVGRIAVGGMGEVWHATDLVLGRPVAVKLLRSGEAGSEDARARFRGEARHAGSLSHPGIARVYDYREADPPHPPYLVMELVDGPSLARLLDQGPLEPARTMDLVAQAARALQAAHSAGLVHRDIKPGNLLVSRDGTVKITDFGIAHADGSATLTSPGMLMGTPAYMAPERVAGAPATPATDLYALGIVAYQCLTGSLPFQGGPLAVALAQMEQPVPELPPSLPAEVAALVAELTAKDPRARPGSAGQVAGRAEQLRNALTEAGPGTGLPRRPAAARAPAGTDLKTVAWALPGERGDASRRRGVPGRRIGGRLNAVVVLAVIALFAAAGWVMAGAHGPGPGLPSVTQRPGPAASHPAHRATHARRTGGTTTVDTPSQAGRPAASRTPPASKTSVSPTPGPTATQSPTPSGTPSPSRTPSPSGTPTGSPAPTGTPTAVPSSGLGTAPVSETMPR